jgi:hypothetical protein
MFVLWNFSLGLYPKHEILKPREHLWTSSKLKQNKTQFCEYKHGCTKPYTI